MIYSSSTDNNAITEDLPVHQLGIIGKCKDGVYMVLLDVLQNLGKSDSDGTVLNTKFSAALSCLQVYVVRLYIYDPCKVEAIM
jgi:hypothetical protein